MIREYLKEINETFEKWGIETRVTEPPKSLFKYRNFSCHNECRVITHLENFKNGVEFLCPTNNFNDPYDSKIFIDEIMSNDDDTSLENVKLDMQQKTFVISLSASDITTNFLMWNHYSCNHKGFCIKYDLEEVLTKIANKGIMLSPVIYHEKPYNLTCDLLLYLYKESLRKSNIVQHNEIVQSPNIMFKTVLIKYEQWKYEQEWRLISNKEYADKNEQKFHIPKPKAIYLGAKIKSENRDKIIKIAKNKKIKVYQMEFSKKDKYELEAIPL